MLFVCIGSTIGKCALASIELTSNQQINAIFPSSSFCPDFLYYAVSASVPRIKSLAGEQAVPLINKSQFSESLVALPSLAEQRAIAEALSDVDGLLDGLDQLISKKRDLKQAAMQQLLTGQTRLPGFSGVWKVRELGQLGKISGAGVDKKLRPAEAPVRLVNYMDVYRRAFIRSKDLDHIVSASPEQAARCAVGKGDVFFTPSSEMPFDIAASAVAVEDIPDACYRLLNFLVSNCSWKSGELTATLRQPFDLLLETTLALEKGKAADGMPTALLRFGSPGRTRTSDKAVNSPVT